MRSKVDENLPSGVDIGRWSRRRGGVGAFLSIPGHRMCGGPVQGGVVASSTRYTTLLEIGPGNTEITAVPAGVWKFQGNGRELPVIEVRSGIHHTIDVP